MNETLWHIVLIDSLPEGGLKPISFYEYFHDQYEVDQFVRRHKTIRTHAWFAGALTHHEIAPRRKKAAWKQKLAWYRV